ncbi:MAG: FtsK/SpoIIIE domain-containing protein [Microbacteriaceae bacterium]
MTPIAEMVRRWWSTSAPWALPGLDDHDGLRVGVDAFNGRPLRWPLGHTHMLIAGVTGSGKSTVLRGLLSHAAARPDIVVVGIDLKAVELAPWAPRLSALAVEHPDARALLHVVVDELRGRRDVLRARRATSWDPAWGPWIVVAVDELAEVLEPASSSKAHKDLAVDCIASLVSIARLGRALGVLIVGATQRPDAETMTGQMRSQFDTIVGLRVRRPEDSRIIAAGAADLTMLRAHEAVYVRPVPAPLRHLRADYIDPGQVAGRAARTARLRPRLDRFDLLAGVR